MNTRQSYWMGTQKQRLVGGLIAVAVLLTGLAFLLPNQAARGQANDQPAAPATTAEPSEGQSTTTAVAQAPQAWTAARIADLPVPMEAAGVAAFDGRIWSVGGMSPQEPDRPALADVFVYDPSQDRWTEGPRLPEPTSHVALVTNGEQLFAVGGWTTQQQPVDTVLRLDKETGRWEQAPPLPVPNAAGAAAWDGNRIVYGGGMTEGGAASDEVWALRADGDRWEFLGQLQEPRHHLAAASDGQGSVWFMGGRDDTLSPNQLGGVDEVTANGVFPLVTEVTPNQGAAAVWWPGVGPCMIGGHGLPDGGTRPAYIDAVECPNGNGSVRLPALTTPRAGVGAALLDNQIYIIGGHGPGFTGSDINDAFRPDPAAGSS